MKPVAISSRPRASLASCWSVSAPSVRPSSPACLPFARDSQSPSARSRRWARIRLGKRTEGRSPHIADVLPIASTRRRRVRRVGSVRRQLLRGREDRRRARGLAARIRSGPSSRRSQPWPAVFDRQYVKRLDGPNVKKGKNKNDLADQVIADIRKFKADQRARSPRDGVVRQHGNLHDGICRRTSRSTRSRQRSRPAIRRFRRAWSTPMRR